ncbi:MAG: autotransporter-associated beta strand repeat-containing protein, partial [Methylobacteriaceae bacterium]|nr:autotransporter-associated beta strand repeat-containing protein [Methylobacteriaceae bacterium]
MVLRFLSFSAAPPGAIQGSNFLPGVGFVTATGGSFYFTNSILRDGTVGRLGLLVTGSAQVTFDGAQTFTGGTTIDGSTARLRLTSPAAAGGANGVGNTVTLTSGTLSLGAGTYGFPITLAGADGRIEVTDADVATAGGAITSSGAFGFAKTGSGTLTLTGANTYTGGTTISAGTLQVGAGGTVGSITGNVANSGSLVFNRADAVTFGGVVSGTGSLTQAGSGTLTLTGASTYTGGTTVAAGTLALTGSASLVSAVGVGAGANLANAGTLSGALTNAGTATNAGTVSGGVTNSGSFTTSGTVATGLTNTGAVTASGGRVDGVILNNAGTFTVTGPVGTTGTFGNAAGATLAITGSGAYTLSGLLTNAGAVTVAGGGSLTAGGVANSGSITVAAGGTVTDTLTNTGAVANAGTYNADVTNAAGATFTNTGTVNTLTTPFANGGTFVSTGTITGGLANTGTARLAGTLTGTVTNAAGASVTATGPLAGIGRLTNEGTFDLGGQAVAIGSLAGSTTTGLVRNGTLSAGSDGSSTTYAGRLADGTGPTALAKTGAGTLTLTGANSFTGGLTVAGGTLVASVESVGTGRITNAGALVLDQGTDATLAAAIDGTGSLEKRGAGTLTYAGTGALTGPTSVTGGTLGVTGSLTGSPVTLGSGTTLFGTGTVGGLAVASGATVAPGPAGGGVGTLSVSGNVLFAPGSLFQVSATPAAASRISASGTATLGGGTVSVLAGTGLYLPGARYTILSAAGGLAGQFSSLQTTTNLAFLQPSLAYDATSVSLGFAQVATFPQVALTRNEAATAGALQGLGPGNPLFNAIVGQSATGARLGFTALSGEVQASAVGTIAQDAFLLQELILDHLRFGNGAFPGLGGLPGFGANATVEAAYAADLPGPAAPPSPVPLAVVPNDGLWGQAFGSFGETGGTRDASRLARQVGGFVLGAETGFPGLPASASLLSGWRAGVVAGYARTTFDVPGRLSTGSLDNAYGGAYAFGPLGPLELRVGTLYTELALDTRRTALFPGFADRLGGKSGGDVVQGFGEAGYRIRSQAGYLEP